MKLAPLTEEQRTEFILAFVLNRAKAVKVDNFDTLVAYNDALKILYQMELKT